jgi:hypothetical protein
LQLKKLSRWSLMVWGGNNEKDATYLTVTPKKRVIKR